MRILLIFTFVFLISITPALAGENIIYHDGDAVLEGYWVPSACPDRDTPAPTVLVIHQWMGLTEYEKMRADMLAKECYNAFAIDMYGRGIRPSSKEEAGKLATLYKSDPALARKRITAALDYVRNRKDVKSSSVAAIGYCFGGTMALELARSGADIAGVISFHGGLSTPAPLTQPGTIKAAVQVHHGAADPFVPPEEVSSFMKEMDVADADWALTQYADAVHAFTQKNAGNDPSTGAAYNEKADRRSWSAALDFLGEILK